MDVPGIEKENQESESKISWAEQINKARNKISSGIRKTKKGGKDDSREDDKLNEELNKLLSPEFLRDYLRAPADYMMLRTGHEHWLISDKEIDQTAVPASLVARRYCTFDPIYLAVFATLIGLVRTYGTRIVEELRLMRIEAAEREKS